MQTSSQIQIPTKEQFQETLNSLGLDGEVLATEERSPMCRYTVRLSAKTKFSKLEGMVDDMALSMRSISPPIVRPDYSNGTIIVEAMFAEHPTYTFSEIFDKRKDLNLPILLGTVNIRDPLYVDMVKMPHLILAGSTGSGKSMMLHGAIHSMLAMADDVGIKLALVDPKLVEFDRYSESKSLLYPVINDADLAIEMLQDLRLEMNERFRVFQKHKCRDILEYRSRIKKIPYIVLVIDELADLIKIKGFEKLLCELAQKSRAAGIHIIAATQHPSSKVLTAEIKANFPSKISCKVSTRVHSQVVLERAGAEHLLGKGDAILIDESGATHRFKGCYVPNKPVAKVSKPTPSPVKEKNAGRAAAKAILGFFGKKN